LTGIKGQKTERASTARLKAHQPLLCVGFTPAALLA